MEPFLSGGVPDGQVDPLAPNVQLLVEKWSLEQDDNGDWEELIRTLFFRLQLLHYSVPLLLEAC